MTQLIVIVMTKPCKRERFGWADSVNGNFLPLLMTRLGKVPIIPTHVVDMEACKVIIHHRQIRSTQHCLPNPAVTEQCLQNHRATSATVFNFDIKYSYYQHWISNTSYNAMFAGLSCHSCNSIYDRRCGDPYDAYTTEIVDCEQVNTIRFDVGIFFIFLSDIGEHFKTLDILPQVLINWWYFCHRSGGSWPMWMELRALQHFVERRCRQVQCADF